MMACNKQASVVKVITFKIDVHTSERQNHHT